MTYSCIFSQITSMYWSNIFKVIVKTNNDKKFLQIRCNYSYIEKHFRQSISLR